MCGRYALWSDRNQILKHFGLENAPLFSHSYNIAPTHPIPVVRLHQDKRELVNCHWGLVPHWARDAKIHPINARAESLNEKPFFRDSFRRRRCLIPANGFYEWNSENFAKLNLIDLNAVFFSFVVHIQSANHWNTQFLKLEAKV